MRAILPVRDLDGLVTRRIVWRGVQSVISSRRRWIRGRYNVGRDRVFVVIRQKSHPSLGDLLFLRYSSKWNLISWEHDLREISLVKFLAMTLSS